MIKWHIKWTNGLNQGVSSLLWFKFNINWASITLVKIKIKKSPLTFWWHNVPKGAITSVAAWRDVLQGSMWRGVWRMQACWLSHMKVITTTPDLHFTHQIWWFKSNTKKQLLLFFFLPWSFYSLIQRKEINLCIRISVSYLPNCQSFLYFFP